MAQPITLGHQMIEAAFFGRKAFEKLANRKRLNLAGLRGHLAGATAGHWHLLCPEYSLASYGRQGDNPQIIIVHGCFSLALP
jgi:hypothetical protein